MPPNVKEGFSDFEQYSGLVPSDNSIIPLITYDRPRLFRSDVVTRFRALDCLRALAGRGYVEGKLLDDMMDIPLTIERMPAANPGMPDAVSSAMRSHLAEHHLSPRQVGEIATRTGASSVVVTHFSGWEKYQPGHMQYLQDIAAAYNGPFLIADDMDAF